MHVAVYPTVGGIIWEGCADLEKIETGKVMTDASLNSDISGWKLKQTNTQNKTQFALFPPGRGIYPLSPEKSKPAKYF